MEKTVKKPRNPRIEALRLVAIVAIAVFHTFQPWFAAAADASSELALSFPWLGNTGCLAVLGWLNLLGVVAAGFGLGLFITNRYNVWADTWGNLNQYGSLTGAFSFFNSQGGPFPAAALIVLGLAASICGVISCFGGKENAK